MTKKIFRISNMTLGLALLLLGNGMNHAKADFTIQWPKDNKYIVYEAFLALPNQNEIRIADGPTSGISHYKVSVLGTKPWSWPSYKQGVIYILVNPGSAGAQTFNLPMTLWTKAESNTINDSINDVLNKTTLTLNSNGTFTITYPN